MKMKQHAKNANPRVYVGGTHLDSTRTAVTARNDLKRAH